MPKTIKIDSDLKAFESELVKAFQSGNLNFIIGSGASMPAIKVAGDIEIKIQDCFEEEGEEEAYKLIYSFLSDLQEPNAGLISDVPLAPKVGETSAQREARQEQLNSTLQNYKDFISTIETILNLRKTNILPKQTNIFTTNYDVFFEKTSEFFPSIKFNDGFTRTTNLKGLHYFSSQNFFNSLYNTGNLYNYKVEIPTVNLIKIHGSLTWKKIKDEIHFKHTLVKPADDLNDVEQLKSYVEKFEVILPQKGKFRETILDRTYYDLLRLYANELDKENTLLITFGFSFTDEHIRDITKRALKNPILKLIVFAFNSDAAADFNKKFDGYSNVEIIEPENESIIDFTKFNEILACIPGDTEQNA